MNENTYALGAETIMEKNEKVTDKNVDGVPVERLCTSHLTKQEDKLKALYDVIYALDQSAIVAITDPQGTITFVNDLFCEVTQYNRHELIGQNHRILNSGFHSKKFFHDLWEQIKTGHIWKGDMKNKKKDGSLYWVHATIVPFLNEKGEPYQYLSIRTEITKQKYLEAEVINSNEKYRLIAENSTDLLSLIEENGAFQYVSPSFEKLVEDVLPFIEKSTIYDWIHIDDREFVRKEITTLFKRKKGATELEFRIQNKQGEYIDVEAKMNFINAPTFSNNSLLLIVIRDIRIQKIIERQIYHLAYHDALTNLPNRRSFMNHLHNEIIDRKYSKSKLAILFIDLDNFKSINDQWGHEVGDLVLKEAAQTIQGAIRPTDMVARLGGDEFIVMLKDVEDQQELTKYVERILMKFQTPLLISEHEYMITCSIGVASYPENGESAEELIKNADAALYSLKGHGKNGFVLFDKNIENQSFERRLLENALRSAIREQQFYLEYQPKLNLSTHELMGMEALIRWKHPDLGTIPPGKFIPLAEKTGLIIPLGKWILRESCRQAKQWQTGEYSPLLISVNVSVIQLEDPHFIDIVKEILQETGFNPKWLELEVTESIFADVKNSASILQEIRNLGIQISIDDFGTGYSSLSYLKNLPVDTLKVDQSFVKDIHTNDDSRAIVNAVITLANTLGLKVIAEGIELQEHIEELNKDGCIFGQGYYFSRPLTSEAFEEYLKHLTNAN